MPGRHDTCRPGYRIRRDRTVTNRIPKDGVMPATGVDRPGARWWVPEQRSLDSLRAGVQGCKGCELYEDAIQGVMGIDPDQVFRTNIVKHFRFSGTRGKQRIHKSPSRVHVAACGPWLVAELELVQPTGVLLLGGTAGKALYGSSFRVGAARGRLEDWPEDIGGSVRSEHVPEWVLATTHPSAVLRSRNRDEDFELFVRDLRVAADTLAS
jgi:uracil-DNA glycosylase family 4